MAGVLIMSEVKTVFELAAEVNKYLVRDKRADDKQYVKLAAEAPEWMQELMHTAHADTMPDDWRYEFIEDAITLLENDDDEIDIDSLYPYTHSRLAWLSSRLDRSRYCDEALEDYGGSISKIDDAIAMGMAREIEEVLSLVRTALEERENELMEAAEASNDAEARQEEDAE